MYLLNCIFYYVYGYKHEQLFQMIDIAYYIRMYPCIIEKLVCTYVYFSFSDATYFYVIHMHVLGIQE